MNSNHSFPFSNFQFDSSEENSLIMSNLADNFKSAQKTYDGLMSYDVLFSSKTSKATVCSLANKLYETSKQSITSIMECLDELNNSNLDAEKLTRVKQALATSKTAFENILTNLL